jgi:hypothetical protein
MYMPIHVMLVTDILSIFRITCAILKLTSIEFVIHRTGKCILEIKQHKVIGTDNVIIPAQNSAQIPGINDGPKLHGY